MHRMVREKQKHQSPERSWSPSSTSSRKSGRDDAPEDMEVVFDGHELVTSFDTATVRTAEQFLRERNIPVLVVAIEYIDRMQDFQQRL